MSFRKWFDSSHLTLRQRFTRIAIVFLIGLLGMAAVTVAIRMDVAAEDEQAQLCLAFMFFSAFGTSFCAIFAAITVGFEAWLLRIVARHKEKGESDSSVSPEGSD